MAGGLISADARRLIPAIGVCVVLYVAIAGWTSFPIWGYCGDEGFYSSAARNVARGMRPYRDFLFIQMPFLTYVYAAWFALWGPSIEAGRLLSVLMTVASIVLTMLTCERRAGFWPAVVAGLLWSTSLYTVADLSSIKTQSLCNFLICATLFLVPNAEDDRLLARAAAAMGLMSLGFFTRLTLVIPLVILWMFLAWECRRRLAAYLGLVALNVVILAAAWSFFWSDGNMWFGVYVSHHDFYGAGAWTWARLGWTVKYSLGNQLVLAGLFLLAVIRLVTMAWERREQQTLAFPAYLCASYGAVTLAHWAQVQNYPTHQTVITGFAITFVAIMLGPVIESIVSAGQLKAGAAWGAFVLMCVPFSESGDLMALCAARSDTDSLTRAGATLRQHAKPGDQLLSFNTELAINGGYELYPGCDLSEWSYLAGLPEDAAAKCHALTLPRLLGALKRADAPIVTLTERDFQIMATGREEVAKELKQLLEDRYQNVAIVKRYGQFQQDLYIFKRMGE